MSSNQHGIPKAKFDLENYYTRKLSLLQSHPAKLDKLNKKNNEWKFKNCGLISLEKESRIKPNQIFESIKVSLSAVLFESIEDIGQQGSSKKWTIQFKSTSAFKKSLSEKIIISDNTYSILDADYHAG